MSVSDEFTGARRTMRRRLNWSETDAAGHNHFSAAVRWLEEAEHSLWREIGQIGTVPMVPRVHVELDYRGRVWFDDELEVTIGVIRLGRTSVTFGTEVRRGDELVVEARHVVAYCPDPRAGAEPWPEEIASQLSCDQQL